MSINRRLVGLLLCVLGAMGNGVWGQTHSEHAPGGVPAPVVGMGEGFAEPAGAGDQDGLGRGIQRAMSLLAGSTAEHRNRVKILFYGQSITEQEWTKAVAADLRRRFPHADLDIQNRAIGGFASDLLLRSAEADVYPWYPDLVIFHVYGAHDKYDRIIHNIRSRTTAEVLMQKDHATAWPDPGATHKQGLWWDHIMNDIELPAIAKRFGCGLVDVRSGWVDYLKAQKMEPKELLIDGVHLNKRGNFLMARLVSQYLIYRPDLPADDWQNLVTDVAVKPEDWKDDTLTIGFTGNRVDAVLAAPADGRAVITIDDKAPSAFDGCYAFTRVTPGPWAGPLFIDQVYHDAPLQVETWTYSVKEVRDHGKAWSFSVHGSLTGDDGEGDSEKMFISKSSRVRVDPTDYFRGFSPPLAAGTAITWSVEPHFTDTITPENSSVGTLTLAQRISNTGHTLKIRGRVAGLRTVRVYCPSVTKEPALALPVPQ